MESRLLKSIYNTIRSSKDPELWAYAMCRAASHHGRQGRLEEANDAIARVRERFGNKLSPSIGAWLMLSEGIIHFFQERRSEADERIRRAYAISVAAGLKLVRPACSAWMAHIDFNLLRFEDMVVHLDEALRLAGADDHQAQARASLVLADALHFSGDFLAAKPWYEKTRQHATSEGDEATLSALLHNVAAFRVGNIRVADAFGAVSPLEAKRARMEAISALSFDIGIGTASFTMLLPLLHGQLLTVDQKYEEAEAVLQNIDLDKLETKSIPLLLVDLAWCNAVLGKREESFNLVERVVGLISASTDIDEFAYINARLAQIAVHHHDASRAQEFRDAAVAAFDRHRQAQAVLRRRLTTLSNII